MQGDDSLRNRARRGSIVDAFPQLSPYIASLRDVSAPENLSTEAAVNFVEEDMFEFDISPSPPIRLNNLIDVQAFDSSGTGDPSWHYPSKGSSQLDLQISPQSTSKQNDLVGRGPTE